MNSKTRYKKISMILFVIFLIGGCLWATTKIKPLLGLELDEVEKLFTNDFGVQLVLDESASDTFETVDLGTINRDFDLDKSGVLLKSSTAGSSIDLTPTFSGNFEMTFRAFSETSHYDETGNDYRSSSIDMTPYADLREVAFDFEDIDGNKFTVLITAGEKWNTITPAARVNIFGSEVGYHYLGDATTPSQTTLKNSGGYYTRIGGTTFSNVAKRGSLTSEDSMPVTFGYNAETMEVYVLHYGTNSIKDAEYRVVLDLNDDSMGLRKLENFNDYKVSIRMNQIASGREANMVIYDINGQNLNGIEFNNNIGPELNYSVKHKALLDQPFNVSSPIAYDLLEGLIDFTGLIRVEDPDGLEVNVLNQNNDVITNNLYSENNYFIPNKLGVYQIYLQGTDNAGILGEERVYQLEVIEDFIQSEYLVKGNYTGLIESSSLGLNSNFTIYPALVKSNMHLENQNLKALVTLTRNGEVFENIDMVQLTENLSVNLNLEGDYRLTYSTPDFGNLGNTYSIDFNVNNQTPVFEVPDLGLQVKPQSTVMSFTNVSASFNGETKNATTFLYGPDGNRITLDSNKSTVLDKIGTYKIVYMVNFNQTYTYNQYFEVGYGTNDIFVSTSRTGKVEANSNSGDLFPSKLEGIKLTAGQENDTFVYQNIIDLTQNTKTDSLIELMILPSEIGELDFWQLNLKLTDIHNPKNVVNIIVFKGSWGNEWSYVRAGANNQSPAGWENGEALIAYNTGTPISFSFTGESNLNSEILNLFYDNYEKALYIDNIKRPGYSYENQVIDFDSAACFNEKMLWEGFTTGEVELSISFQSLQTGSATVLVKSVNGVNLSGEWLIDDEEPRIFTDFKGYETNDLPKGVINQEYPIFPAKAYDKIDGTIDYEIKVFKDYQTANQTEYSVIDGRFLPDLAGDYTIVYQAIDSANNSVVYPVTVEVLDNLEEMKYIFSEQLILDVFFGTNYFVPKGEALGGSGYKNVVLEIISPSDEVIDLVNNSFDITETGVYQIRVTLVDFLGNTKVITHSIQSTISSSPIVHDVEVRPVFINGVTYTLPDFEAYDYYSNLGVKQEAIKSIEIKVNGETYTLDSNRTLTPIVSSNGEEIEIKYIAKAINSNLTTEIVFKANVVIVKEIDNSLDLANFFYQENVVEIEKADSYIDYIFNEGAKLVFANPLIANQLNFGFTVPIEYNNYSSILVTLTDSENPDIAIDILLEKSLDSNSTTSYISINGGKKIAVSGSFFEVTSFAFKLQYNATSQYLVDLNGNHLLEKITNTNTDKEFVGFPSGKVYLSYSFKDVTGPSAIRIVSIGNQIFSNDTIDRIRPQIELKSFITRVGEINEPFKAPGAYVGDILDPVVSLTLTIRNSKGVVYEGPIDEDYYFNPTEYGVYRFIYTAIDSSNRKFETTYIVTIKDRIPPVITIDGTIPEFGKVNNEITLPNAVVTDNNDEELRLWIFVMGPNGEVRALEEGVNTFIPTLNGEYKITYYAKDSYNSYVYHQYKIIVN